MCATSIDAVADRSVPSGMTSFTANVPRLGSAIVKRGITRTPGPFAVKASSDKPPSGFVTGRDGSYADLASQADSAHASAILADVGFGVAIVAGVGAALLYFLRPKDEAAPTAQERTTSGLRMRAGPFSLQGSF